MIDMSNATSRQFGTNRVTPGEAIRSYVYSRAAHQTKNFKAGRILVSFGLPVVLPVAMLLRRWAPPSDVILGLCFGTLFCAILLNAVARDSDAREMERNYQSSCAFASNRMEPPSTLRVNIEFCILCAFACSIFFVLVGIFADAFTRDITIVGGSYLFGVLLFGILQLGWQAVPFVRGRRLAR